MLVRLEMLLALQFPLHQFANGFTRVTLFVKDGMNLLGDRHLQFVTPRQFQRSGSGSDSLGDHSRRREDLLERPTTAQLFSHRPIPAKLACASKHQIPHAGEA